MMDGGDRAEKSRHDTPHGYEYVPEIEGVVQENPIHLLYLLYLLLDFYNNTIGSMVILKKRVDTSIILF